MITNDDCLLMLADIRASGVDTSKIETELMTNGATRKVVKFIKDNGDLDIYDFYRKIRKSYNDKRSKLYINIVKEDFTNIEEVPTTMASYILQTLLYARNAKSSNVFLEQSRYIECCESLSEYGKSGDLVPCIRLLQIIKREIKALEELE